MPPSPPPLLGLLAGQRFEPPVKQMVLPIRTHDDDGDDDDEEEEEEEEETILARFVEDDDEEKEAEDPSPSGGLRVIAEAPGGACRCLSRTCEQSQRGKDQSSGGQIGGMQEGSNP